MKIYKILTLLIISLSIQYNAFCININSTSLININTNVTITSIESPILTQNGTNILNEVSVRHNPIATLACNASSLDLTAVDSTCKGFQGGFTDGKYGYCIPNNNGALFGKITRIDLSNFTTNGVSILDLTTVNAGYKGFVGGFTDGRYGYCVPYNNGSMFGVFVRFDLNNFTTSGVSVINLTTVDASCKGYASGFINNNYAYLSPQNNGATFGRVARIDLNNFTTSGVTTLELTNVNPNCKGFSSGVTYKNYGYFIPNTYSILTRVDLNNFTTNGVTTLDLSSIDSALKGYRAGTCDGEHLYMAPYYNGTTYIGKIVRVDLNNFTTNGVTVLDLTTIDSSYKGFFGIINDNKYIYTVPFQNAGSTSFGKIARININDFTTNGVTIIDTTTLDSTLKGYIGGFYLYPYIYMCPFLNNTTYFGKFTRVLVDYGGNF